MEIRNVQVTRYVTPFREGGSLPALAEADDGFLYVVKFYGAGQGPKALIADLIGSEIARAGGLKVPELVLASLDSAFGRTEPDPEIQDLLRASIGLNLGSHYLSGAISYDPAAEIPDHVYSSRVVWLDAFLMNVDRTARNTNILCWNNELWLIDFGAALYFHHSWDNWRDQTANAFPLIKDHVLLREASELESADQYWKERLNGSVLDEVVKSIPEPWLVSAGNEPPENMRQVYRQFLENRIQQSDIFLNEAIHARKLQL